MFLLATLKSLALVIILMVLTCALWSYGLGLCFSSHCGGLKCFPFKFRLDGFDCFSSSFCFNGWKFVLVVLSALRLSCVLVLLSSSWWFQVFFIWILNFIWVVQNVLHSSFILVVLIHHDPKWNNPWFILVVPSVFLSQSWSNGQMYLVFFVF